MLLETTLLACLTLLLLYGYIRQKWKVLNELNIPHDQPTLRNFGHTLIMLGKNFIEYDLQCKKKYGSIWGFYMFTQPRINIHDPEILRHVLVKEFSSFRDRVKHPADFGAKEFEQGLLAAPGTQWKRMRTTLNPTFSNMKLKGMSGIVNGCIRNTLSRIEKWDGNRMGAVDIKDLFQRLSLDAICSTIFSVDVNSQDEAKAEPEIAKYAKEVFEVSLTDRIKFVLKFSFPFLRKYIGDGGRARPLSYFRNICQILVNRRTSRGPEEDAIAPHRTDVMDAMINARSSVAEIACEEKGLTDSEILGNAISMLLAGYETTGVAMTYLAYNLACHVDVQQKLQAEIDEAFPQGTEVDFDSASNLKYLDMCIKESLRLYCPVVSCLRCATRDFRIGDFQIPKGTVLAIPVTALCRDPEFWEDPMLYNPERMRDMSKIDPMIYQPFGSGPRNCIGLKFALMEIKLAFCAILKKYTFYTTAKSPKPPLTIQPFTTTSPVDDVILQLFARQPNTTVEIATNEIGMMPA